MRRYRAVPVDGHPSLYDIQAKYLWLWINMGQYVANTAEEAAAKYLLVVKERAAQRAANKADKYHFDME